MKLTESNINAIRKLIAHLRLVEMQIVDTGSAELDISAEMSHILEKRQ